MCMFRFPDPDFERSFYRDLFGIEPGDREPRRNLDWPVDPDKHLLQKLDDQLCQEPVTAR